MIFTKTNNNKKARIHIHTERNVQQQCLTQKKTNTVLTITQRPVSGESGVVSANAIAYVTLSTMQTQFQHSCVKGVNSHKDT